MQSSDTSISQLLQDLRGNSSLYIRRDAAIALGKLQESNEDATITLLIAKSSDSSAEVRQAASTALEASIHDQFIKNHPDITEKLKAARNREIEQLQTELNGLNSKVLIAGIMTIAAAVGIYLVFANLSRMFYEGQGPVLIGMILSIGSVIFLYRTNAKETFDLFTAKTKELTAKRQDMAKMP